MSIRGEYETMFRLSCDGWRGVIDKLRRLASGAESDSGRHEYRAVRKLIELQLPDTCGGEDDGERVAMVALMEPYESILRSFEEFEPAPTEDEEGR